MGTLVCLLSLVPLPYFARFFYFYCGLCSLKVRSNRQQKRRSIQASNSQIYSTVIPTNLLQPQRDTAATFNATHVLTFNIVLSLLEACFDLILSPSPSMKIQIMGGKITENLGFKFLLRKVKIFCSFFFSFSNSSHKTTEKEIQSRKFSAMISKNKRGCRE